MGKKPLEPVHVEGTTSGNMSATIIPVTCNTRRKICLKSWDGFQIPLPFSRCELVLNKPIYVPREADRAGREEGRSALESHLRQTSMD